MKNLKTMEKQELKEVLMPYLPYRLNIKNKIGKIVELTLSDAPYHFKTEFKPILRPLSDLTKEIEHNGEKFVPYYQLKVLGLVKTASLRFETIILELDRNRIFYIPDYHDFFQLPYQVVQKLISWHFDVFGLIEKGLAIDINNLNK